MILSELIIKYSTALKNVAKKKGISEEICKNIEKINIEIKSKNIKDKLNNPFYPQSEKLKIFKEMSINPLLFNCISEIISNKRYECIFDILENTYQGLKSSHEKIIVTTSKVLFNILYF